MRTPDSISRFVIENSDVRGLLVHLDDTWLSARSRMNYPAVVERLLGEAFAATVLMSASIKYEGKLTLQVRGSGPVNLLVVQVTREGTARGLAKWDAVPEQASLGEVFGTDARMVISVEADAIGQPHQGIVELTGNTLSDALKNYFHNSEQLLSEFYLEVSNTSVAGLLLQRLPGGMQDDDGWERATQLARTVSRDELLQLDASTLLYRLFNQDGVRLFENNPVSFKCSCSRERTSGVIQGLGQTEAEQILSEQGSITITCEFCAEEYIYDSVDVAGLFNTTTTDQSDTRH